MFIILIYNHNWRKISAINIYIYIYKTRIHVLNSLNFVISEPQNVILDIKMQQGNLRSQKLLPNLTSIRGSELYHAYGFLIL